MLVVPRFSAAKTALKRLTMNTLLIREIIMDYFKVLKRAWEITWRYRALWVFGILVALATGGGGGSGGGGSSGGNIPSGQGPFNGGEFPGLHLGSEVVTALVVLAVALVLFLVLLGVVLAIGRYIASTALIRMTDHYEETGEKVSVRQGFRLGWSRASWRLFLIDLLVSLPAVILALVSIGIALVPLLLWTTRNNTLGVLGTVATIGLVFLAVLLIVLLAVALNTLREFFWRVCVLEGQGVLDSIRKGFGLVKRRLGNVAMMWLIMLGIGLGYTIITIPVFLVLLLAGVLIGGIPALLVGLLVHLLVAEGAAAWIAGGLVGLPVMLLVIVVPSIFIGGIYQTFNFNVWTLTYRELRALEQVAAEPMASVPLPEPPAMEEPADQA